MPPVKTGLESFIANPPTDMQGCRIGLLCNPASIDSRFQHARDLVNQKFPGRLKALFSPQHGFFAEKQDNMIESDDWVESVLGIPVFSLYGRTRQPTRDMLDLIDILVVDLQDVGTRVYTFAYTLSYCLEAAGRFGKKIIVLDRPNPINGRAVEGNCLSPEYASFVGRYPIPMRHGLTIGELARLFNEQFGIGCDLTVVPMKGWKRGMYFADTGLPWIPPSPNLPTPVSALVYPGQVLWEGTNVSEGRGTAQPFELFGAPYFDTQKLLGQTAASGLKGILLRPVVFEPTANKWAGESCRGFQIHLLNLSEYRPYRSTLRLLQAVIRCHRDRFEWKPPPYEYEFERLPVDLIMGSRHIRERIEGLDDLTEIEKSWQKDLDRFIKISEKFHLYTQ